MRLSLKVGKQFVCWCRPTINIRNIDYSDDGVYGTGLADNSNDIVRGTGLGEWIRR